MVSPNIAPGRPLYFNHPGSLPLKFTLNKNGTYKLLMKTNGNWVVQNAPSNIVKNTLKIFFRMGRYNVRPGTPNRSPPKRARRRSPNK